MIEQINTDQYAADGLAAGCPADQMENFIRAGIILQPRQLALAGVPAPESAEPEISPAQQQLLDAVKRVYGQAAADRDSSRVAAPQQPPNVTN